MSDLNANRRLRKVTMETPCYVISSNGFRDSVSYKDDWCYGRSEHLGYATDFAWNHRQETARDLIKADIRQHLDERNGLPIYTISDHGNTERVRAIRLRRSRKESSV